jgi:hypothetical protein
VRCDGRAEGMAVMGLPVLGQGALLRQQVLRFEGPPAQGTNMINRRDCMSAFAGSLGEIGYDASNDTEVRPR